MAKKPKKPTTIKDLANVADDAGLETSVSLKSPTVDPTMPDVSAYLALLGKQGRDKISGYAGTVVTVSFDLFGCVQAILKPPIDKDGKLEIGHFFDVNRIDITEHARKMPVPNYPPLPEQHAHGPADKPAPRA